MIIEFTAVSCFCSRTEDDTGSDFGKYPLVSLKLKTAKNLKAIKLLNKWKCVKHVVWSQSAALVSSEFIDAFLH